MAYQERYQADRWPSWINDSSETAPAFGCFSIEPLSGDTAYEWTGRSLLLKGNKPSTSHEALQFLPWLAINGPLPVKAGYKRTCTQEYPARVLALIDDGITAGDLCGPKAGQWYASPTGCAWICQGVDPSTPIDSATGYQVLFVSPAVGLTIFARTAELDQSESYPATSETLLPIAYMDRDDNAATWTQRNAYSQGIYAGSPMGWLPPDCDIEVVPDKGGLRIVRGPTQMHGVAPSQIGAASWDACDSLTMGSGTVNVWRKDGTGKYVPQTYRDGSNVQMMFYNSSPEGAVEADTLLKAALNPDLDWVIDFEPCDGACEAY